MLEWNLELLDPPRRSSRERESARVGRTDEDVLGPDLLVGAHEDLEREVARLCEAAAGESERERGRGGLDEGALHAEADGRVQAVRGAREGEGEVLAGRVPLRTGGSVRGSAR